MNPEHFFSTRHARSERHKSEADPASTEYPYLTEQGVEQARERAKEEILNLVNASPERAVIFIGATSDQPRTKQTAEIYGDTLSQYSKETKAEDVLVFSKNEVEAMAGKPGSKSKTRAVEALQATAEANPDKKIVIGYPTMIKELNLQHDNRWNDSKGNKTEYLSELLKKHENNHTEAVKDWIASGGKLSLEDGRVLHGPLPEKVAQDYLAGLRRMGKFVKKYAGDRPVVIGEVSHQWDIDALVTYLAKGKVDYEAFEEVSGGELIEETEMTSFEINDGKITTNYRGREFVVEPEVEGADSDNF